jgi:predicted O-methyltransferase YrrM
MNMLKRLAGATAKRLYYGLIDMGKPKICAPSGLRELDEIKKHSRVRSEISDHLVTLFTESLSVKPRLIVELGVENGRSTLVFERVARLFNSKLISVDIQDCSGASSYKDWIFVQKDDI